MVILFNHLNLPNCPYCVVWQYERQRSWLAALAFLSCDNQRGYWGRKFNTYNWKVGGKCCEEEKLWEEYKREEATIIRGLITVNWLRIIIIYVKGKIIFDSASLYTYVPIEIYVYEYICTFLCTDTHTSIYKDALPHLPPHIVEMLRWILKNVNSCIHYRKFLRF